MFDKILQYTIPELHPVFVHFPIALGIISLLFAGGWLLRDRLNWFSITLWLQALAFAGGVLALRSGEAMEDQSEGIAIVDELVHYHETMAERTVWVFGLTVVWLLVARWMVTRDTLHSGSKTWIRIVTFLLVLTGAVMVGLTGHIGGLMVWGVAG